MSVCSPGIPQMIKINCAEGMRQIKNGYAPSELGISSGIDYEVTVATFQPLHNIFNIFPVLRLPAYNNYEILL